MPTTLRLQADTPADLARAAEILQRGGLVGFPTETVYGLGAHALSAAAVAGIFCAKQRPAWDPLIVHLTDVDQLDTIAKVRDSEPRRRVRVLSEALWPGPLTLLLPRVAAVPDEVTAGRPLVGVRVPAHPVARELLKQCGLPVAAPSANRFGHVSPTTAQHVLDDLDGRIDAVLDGGPCTIGVESTVVDPSRTPMLLYRAGAITADTLQELTDVAVEVYSPGNSPQDTEPAALPSPGVGIRHYAPSVPVLLTGPSAEALTAEMERELRRAPGMLGVVAPDGWTVPRNDEIAVLRWGNWDDPAALALQLFAALRVMEVRGVRAIVCPLPEPGGLRDALRDRLLKAARPR